MIYGYRYIMGYLCLDCWHTFSWLDFLRREPTCCPKCKRADWDRKYIIRYT